MEAARAPDAFGNESIVSIKERYYLEKLGVTYQRGIPSDEAVLKQVVQSYVEALQWVMLYYFRGCPSWPWFYPFHYAPVSRIFARLF
jgi:5'-3' exonuclease